MKVFYILVFIFFAAVGCGQSIYAQELAVKNTDDFAVDQDAVTKINNVVQKIYDQTLVSKAKFKELVDFNEKCLVKNSDGFLTLTYETQVPSAGGKTLLFAFKLDVEPLIAKTYTSHDGYFNYQMPLLDLQFSGYVIKHPLRRQFDLTAILNQYAEELADYQQQFMPLRFFIVPEQGVYHVAQPIHFKVILANTSKQNLLVSGLGAQSLFFTLNNAAWGTSLGDIENLDSTLSIRDLMRAQQHRQRELLTEQRAQQRAERQRRKNNPGEITIRGKRTQVGDKLILRPDEAIAINFVGEGYRKAQDIEIRGSYHFNIKGLKPTAKVILKIIE